MTKLRLGSFIHSFIHLWLRLGLSQLREHKFRHDFEGTLNPLCSCSIEAETTLHFFQRCQFFNDI